LPRRRKEEKEGGEGKRRRKEEKERGEGKRRRKEEEGKRRKEEEEGKRRKGRGGRKGGGLRGQVPVGLAGGRSGRIMRGGQARLAPRLLTHFYIATKISGLCANTW
jgi:hypothetical protein